MQNITDLLTRRAMLYFFILCYSIGVGICFLIINILIDNGVYVCGLCH